jgi:hypothetical protein
MITLSLNFDGITGKSDRTSHARKVKEIVDTHLAFPGSDKLKMGVTIKDNGFSSVTFAGPRDIVSEARRLWQENVKPAAERVRSVAGKAVSTIKKKASASVNSVKKAVPKKKKVHVKVKKSTAKKASSKKKKNK